MIQESVTKFHENRCALSQVNNITEEYQALKDKKERYEKCLELILSDHAD